jgi:SAM-dependent methyltransferase
MSLKEVGRSGVKGLLRLATLGQETGPHMVRYRMYYDIEEALKGVDKRALGNHVLSISRSLYLCGLLRLPNPQITDVNFPEYNLLNLAFPDATFDYLMCDQVLEHIQGDPQRAIDETHRVLKPGGIAVHTTCLLQELHGLPNDYWRFTPNGLKYLFRNYSRIIQVAGWGNKLAFFALRYLSVPHAKWHPVRRIAMHNNPEAPISTWIIAQK